MDMLKRLLAFLFEEEEIVDDDIEVGDNSSDQPILTTSSFESSVHKKETQEDEFVLPPLTDAPKSMGLKSIEADEPVIKPLEKVKNDPTVKPYEFSEVISPIFGKSETTKKVVNTQPTIPLESEKSVLGTIISPIYGITKPKKKSIPLIKPVNTVENITLEQVLGLVKDFEIEQVELSLEEQLPTEEQLRQQAIFDLFDDNDKE